MSERFEFVVEKGQVWEGLSPNRKTVLYEGTVRCVEDGFAKFEADSVVRYHKAGSAPTGVALETLMNRDSWRLKEEAA